jgi:MFS superfamily sulfate permease-like transporter
MTDKLPASDSHGASTSKAWPVFRSFAAYRPAFLTQDLVAGLTLAAIAIPEQMATARLGHFTPLYGFFAFLGGSLAFAVFGSNRFLSCGADSTITPIFAGGLVLLALPNSPDYAMLAIALALIVGLFLVIGGICRLGWIADLLSIPVTTGFLVGISAHILISQLPAILGLPAPSSSIPMLARLAALVRDIDDTNPFTLVIGVGVLGVIAASEKINPRIPGALIGLILACAAVVWMGLESRNVTVLGVISVGLPKLAVPDVAVGQWIRLVPLGLIIAIVVMVQTAATTRSFPSDADEPPDVNRDFIGVGAGSVLAGLFGAFPVNASPPRTGIVCETGGRSQLSGLVAVAVVLLLLIFGATLLQHIPEAALGGVLLFVAFRIVHIGQIVAVYRQSLIEFLLIVATAGAIILLPIQQGVGIGITLSLLHGVWSATRARLLIFERIPGTSIWWPASPHIPGETEPGIVVAGFQAPLSFLNANGFREDVLNALHASAPGVRLIVLEATGITGIDFTAAQVFNDLIRRCRAEGTDFAIARLESIQAQDAVTQFGIDKSLGPDRTFHSVAEALAALRAPAA